MNVTQDTTTIELTVADILVLLYRQGVIPAGTVEPDQFKITSAADLGDRVEIKLERSYS